MVRPERAPVADPQGLPFEGRGFRRLWFAFGTARVGAGLVLALVLALSLSEGRPRLVALLGCGLYLVLALSARLVMRRPAHDADPRWLATVGVDLLAVGALQQLPGINYTPLFALPVLMAAVLAGAPLAYGTAAAASGLLLLEALATTTPGQVGRELIQAGLTGAAIFALALLAHQLALRLRREERRARQSQEAALLQAEVNALVIQALAEGVLVVDRQGRVQAVNPTACMLLGQPGLQAGFSLTGHPAWGGLWSLARRALAGEGPEPAGTASTLGVGGRQLQVRTRLAAPSGDGQPLCLMFLEDLREIEARIRTEKLAAMGRMSAAVAHEIRNPLAAISQANALLAEDLQDPAQRQLTGLVDQNAQRLARIVEDVLDVARAEPGGAGAPALPLDEAVRAICGDWGVASGHSRLQLSLEAGAAQVAFDPEHLRRVLGNLLDNAQRHASAAPDAVRVATRLSSEEGAQLQVWSDGAPLDPSVQSHLFEPFFSSSSRSSGLGLFICRELCMRHGAQIGYQRVSGPVAAPAHTAIDAATPGASAASDAAARPGWTDSAATEPLGNAFSIRFASASPPAAGAPSAATIKA